MGLSTNEVVKTKKSPVFGKKQVPPGRRSFCARRIPRKRSAGTYAVLSPQGAGFSPLQHGNHG
jgi:hypothetical protein